MNNITAQVEVDIATEALEAATLRVKGVSAVIEHIGEVAQERYRYLNNFKGKIEQRDIPNIIGEVLTEEEEGFHRSLSQSLIAALDEEHLAKLKLASVLYPFTKAA